MKITLNGESRELPVSSTVADAVLVMGVSDAARGIAVAVEGEVVPRAEWGDHPLAEGDAVEVVHAVQGG